MTGRWQSCRRFPPPWSIDEMNDAGFVVRATPTGRRSAISISSRSRADGPCQTRRMAVNFAKLPELLKQR